MKFHIFKGFPLGVTIATLLMVNVVDCIIPGALIRNLVIGLMKRGNSQKDQERIPTTTPETSGRGVANAADALCSFCLKNNNITCVRQWCTNSGEDIVTRRPFMLSLGG